MVFMSLEGMKRNANAAIRQQEESLRLRAELCPSCPYYGCDEEGLPHKECGTCKKVGTMPNVGSLLESERILECVEKYERFTVDDLLAIAGFNSLDLTKPEFRQNPSVRAVKEKYGLSWSEISEFAYLHTGDPRNRLFLLRKKSGLSQKQLAELSGIAYSRISDYERGAIKIENMTLGTARRLAAALRCTIDELVGRDEAEGGV